MPSSFIFPYFTKDDYVYPFNIIKYFIITTIITIIIIIL